MKKVLNFIKYNNLFTIVIMFVVLGSGVSLAASPTVRDGIISSKNTVRSIDNSYIISADVAHYNFNLKITGITEDVNNYYVAYSYQTIDLVDYVWQNITKTETLNVSKEVLGQGDLGLFVSGQLGKLISSKLAYLQEVKEIETQKGVTQKIVATKYSGLIGSLLSENDKTFVGYVPVIAETADVSNGSGVVPAYIQPESERSKSVPGADVSQPQSDNQNTADMVRQMVEDILKQQNAVTPTSTATTTETNTNTNTGTGTGTGTGGSTDTSGFTSATSTATTTDTTATTGSGTGTGGDNTATTTLPTTTSTSTPETPAVTPPAENTDTTTEPSTPVDQSVTPPPATSAPADSTPVAPASTP